MKYDLIETGKRIKELRTKYCLTQEQFAEELHVSTVHIGKIEKGKGGASIDLLADIACRFDVSLDYLILGKKDLNVEDPKAALKATIEALIQIESSL